MPIATAVFPTRNTIAGCVRTELFPSLLRCATLRTVTTRMSTVHGKEPRRILLAMALAASPAIAMATPSDASGCRAIVQDAARLRCYDAAFGNTDIPAERNQRAVVYPHDEQRAGSGASLLDSRWELDESSKQGEFRIRAYKPVYILPVYATSRVNQFPSSPAEGRTASESRDLQPFEMVYQLSLKTKLWENVFGDNGDLWAGYTQVSHWQIYDEARSRPFSETNYEPELMLTFRTDFNMLGWNGRLFGAGINHQSNGRSNPLSRSWNRAILDIGFERDGWALMLRPWWRIPDSNDDNPDISDYIGRGDLRLVHEWNNHEFALMARHTLRGGDRSRGSLQFDWGFPISGELRGHLQLFNGYGQSLLDYNHRAWYLGIGVSLLEWY